MINIILVFDVCPGVQIRIPARHEAKHFGSRVIEEAGLKLAKSMGVRYSHYEDAE